MNVQIHIYRLRHRSLS